MEVEPSAATPVELMTHTSNARSADAEGAPRALPALNPGLYDPATATAASYADFVEEIDHDTAAWIRRQHMDRVFDELGLFGSPAIGVAVLDNGVLPEWVDYLSTGSGGYRTAGYHPPDVGETHPQDSDFLGLAKVIPNTFDHGTRQSRYIQCFAPRASRATVRGSSLPFLLLPNDIIGATNGILALADDDAVQVVSMSMGTIFRSQEMERAIDELHGRGKILVAAAGTTVPVIRDLIGVVFPATLPTVISATGLSDTTQTGGQFELGSASHGGPENDFVIEPSPASSEAVSSLAGIIATLWAIDPGQPRESILDALVRSSNFYQANGAKDPLFGWGRVDAYQAALTIQQGGCVVTSR
ncbi:MAG: S8/S53 family peptidase [Deltaproteobacteria bacterium]|nr:S8/S53 family peptidase [Deltaproteobacteria bacterium]